MQVAVAVQKGNNPVLCPVILVVLRLEQPIVLSQVRQGARCTLDLERNLSKTRIFSNTKLILPRPGVQPAYSICSTDAPC
jgi:hypothetical protein